MDMVDHIKPKLQRNPMDIILHCSTDDITDRVNNPLKKNRKFAKEIREFDKDNQTNIINLAISAKIQAVDSETS